MSCRLLLVVSSCFAVVVPHSLQLSFRRYDCLFRCRAWLLLAVHVSTHCRWTSSSMVELFRDNLGNGPNSGSMLSNISYTYISLWYFLSLWLEHEDSLQYVCTLSVIISSSKYFPTHSCCLAYCQRIAKTELQK